MGKLTSGDMQELTWWFNSPPVLVAGEALAAQSYEPSSGSSYDPFTDNRLVRLVGAATSKNQSEWARVKRAIDRVCELPNGREHFEMLRLAFGPRQRDSLPEEEFRYPEVARFAPTAILRGRELARESEHMRILELCLFEARTSGCSSIAAATRVIEMDRRILAGIIRLHVDDSSARFFARHAIERALKPRDSDFIVAVKLEMARLVDDAGDAYRTARSEVGATKRADKARKRAENEALLERELGTKRRKEKARFDRRLRSAS